MISNFYPITFPMESFEIERLPYEKDLLSNLRKQHNEENSFFGRDGFVYISPMGPHRVTNGKTVTLEIEGNEEIVGSLVRHLFFRAFKSKHESIIPIDFYPFRIHSRKDEHDLLALALRELNINPALVNGKLAHRKLIEVQFRIIQHNGKHIFGAVINVRYNWTYGKTLSCLTLKTDGFNLVNREVLLVETLPGLANVVAPDETFIGQIVSINDEIATVHTNEGEQTYHLSYLVPLKNRRNIDDILSHYIRGIPIEKIRKEIQEMDSTRLSAQSYQKEVSQMAAVISEMEYRNQDNFTFTISSTALIPTKGFHLEDPVFRFDYAPGASSKNASFGLLQHGPYDSLTFAPKTPRIAVLCHGTSRDAFTSFLGKLRDGIPEASNFSGGMRGKYRLQDIAFDATHDFIEVKTFSAEEYENSVASYLSKIDPSRRPDLVLIQTKDEFKSEASNQNPYYRAKARFMLAGIPTQFLKVETIRKADEFLKYTIDSVALQAYAKMGGIPYVLPAGKNVDREIIVGVGNSVTRSNAYSGNNQDRVVGITTFFKADGEYIFGTPCKEVPYSEYFEALLISLRESIQEIASGYGWREGDSVRLVFHVFKPMKDLEIEVVSKLVKEYPQYAITFAFVTISDLHPFLLFDEQNTKGRIIQNKEVGIYVPKRKTNWVIDENSCLIQLSGLDEIRTAYHGFSAPILVRIHENSTYRDLHAISQQIFNFTFLSWRTFKPTHSPVTLSYANRISSMLSNLKKIDGWRSEVVNSVEMRRKKWFL